MTNSEKLRLAQAFRDREYNSAENKRKRKDRTEQQSIYNAMNSTQVSFKLNNKKDADILDWLKRQQSKQGSIKQLIRAAIAAEQEIQQTDRNSSTL